MSLWRAIERKLQKRYSPGSPARPLWLLIFSTSPCIETLYIRAGRLMVGRPLAVARMVLHAQGAGPFSQVWFTNLVTRPVRVWPPGAD